MATLEKQMQNHHCQYLSKTNCGKDLFLMKHEHLLISLFESIKQEKTILSPP